MALAYLLSPTFEIVNTAGKPATGGYIEVYVSGTRDKYFCASDWNGTLHPFKIPLDSLGSNIVLAADGGAYDVFIYNRYGGLIMSRTNVKPGAGGGMGGGVITSSDGSITVTPTAEGVDLKVNGMEPSVLRAGAGSLTADGQYTFYELVRDGEEITVDSNGKIRLEDGWYHFDATVRVAWEGASLVNSTTPVQLYTTLSSDVLEFDLSYEHSETVQLGGEVKITTGGTQFILGITGLEQGMVAELVDFGIHTITGHGDAAGYEAGDGIVIEDHEISIDPNYVQETLSAGTGIVLEDNEISVDTDVIQEKLTAGNNVQINGNAISATDTTYTAGNGLTLSGTEFAIDTSVVATKSDLPEDEIFYVDVNNPDYDTALAAYNAGKTLVLKGDYYTGYLCRYTPMDGLVFAYNLPWTVAGVATATQVGYMAMRKVTATGETYWYGFSSCAIPNATQGDSGKVLTVSGSNAATWTSLPDLTPYVTDTELSTILQGYQEALTAGSNIQISNGVISATDTTYTAGDGLTLNGTEFTVNVGPNLYIDPNTHKLGAVDTLPMAGYGLYNSSYYMLDVDTSVIQQKLTAGSNIVIEGTTISATAEPQLQANWTEDDSQSVQYIQNKPVEKSLVAGNNITITTSGNNVSISATVPNVPVQGVEVDGTSVVNAQGIAEITMPTVPVQDVEVDGSSVVNASGVAEITMPTIPVTDVEVDGVSVVSNGVASITTPAESTVVAGSNITITESNSTITIAASVPVIGTITI